MIRITIIINTTNSNAIIMHRHIKGFFDNMSCIDRRQCEQFGEGNDALRCTHQWGFADVAALSNKHRREIAVVMIVVVVMVVVVIILVVVVVVVVILIVVVVVVVVTQILIIVLIII